MKLTLFSYPIFVLLSFLFACTTKMRLERLGINPFCPGIIVALAIVLMPVWLLVVVKHVNDSAADDDLYDDYTIDIHYGRSRQSDR